MSDREAAAALVRAAAAALERERQRIDDLNVYPVPDGDTGTNLLLTVRGIVEALDGSTAPDRAALARELTRAALMSARGNSGVILSQVVRGAAEELGRAASIDAVAVVRALRAAADEAYRAVGKPVEGTMLTVIRELADAAESSTAGEPGELLHELVRHGDEAVARTQEQLDVLRRARVVDAGAAGLVELLRGLTAAVSGEELPEPAPVHELPVRAVHQELSRFRYCTTFVIEGDALDAALLERRLEELGDSLLVVGDRSALKVHVHTDDPGAALSLGTRAGAIEGIEIADMHRQTEEREERLLEVAQEPEARCAAVAVVAGVGNRRLFESLGAALIVEGGQTMNPPTADLLAAVDAAHASEVVLLPNNANVVMAAEQAARLAAKPVRVVPARSLQAGLAALVAFNPERRAEDNAAEMLDALESVVTGEVAIASRDAALDGVAAKEGEFLGLLGGKPIAAGASFDEVARAVVEGLLAEPRELMTLLTGEGAPPLNGLLEDLAVSHPELEIDVHDGGQPHYLLLLSAE
jgi:DAK2 domain fusion protein YloV